MMSAVMSPMTSSGRGDTHHAVLARGAQPRRQPARRRDLAAHARAAHVQEGECAMGRVGMIEWGLVGLRVLPLHICEKASRGQVAGGSGKAERGGGRARGAGEAGVGVGGLVCVWVPARASGAERAGLTPALTRTPKSMRPSALRPTVFIHCARRSSLRRARRRQARNSSKLFDQGGSWLYHWALCAPVLEPTVATARSTRAP